MEAQLRDPALDWQGYVITDEGSITFMGPGYHGYVDNLVDAACLAMNAGTDLALGGEFASTLATCLAQGNVTAARLREALTRVLRAQFDLGWVRATPGAFFLLPRSSLYLHAASPRFPFPQFDSLGALKYGTADPVTFNNVSPSSRSLDPNLRPSHPNRKLRHAATTTIRTGGRCEYLHARGPRARAPRRGRVARAPAQCLLAVAVAVVVGGGGANAAA
jgi:beta-glucosidase-like glycosyl hydrolase